MHWSYVFLTLIHQYPGHDDLEISSYHPTGYLMRRLAACVNGDSKWCPRLFLPVNLGGPGVV